MPERFKLSHWIDKLHESRILVVGDMILDRFVFGDISRISPEAPVGVLRAGETKSALGGAGNVVRNLLSLGSYVYFVSVVGDDPEAQEIRDMLSQHNNIKPRLIVERQRKTSIKTRFIASRQQILRVDSETTHWIENHSCEKALQSVQEFIDHCDVVVISDYGKGFLCPHVLSSIIETAKNNGKALLVDPKGKDFTLYRGASMLTPNLKELSEAANLPVDNDDAVVTAARKLIGTCALDALLATRSHEGMSLVLATGDVTHLKAEAREVFDVSGAGDTVVAVMAAAHGVGAPLVEAAELANIAAGIVVGKVGTAVVHQQDLTRAVRRQMLSSAEAKVLDHSVAADRVEIWRRKGCKIGFTNGVFDLLHPGHLSLLAQAKKACDRLIIGLNGDISVRSIKGTDPIQTESARSAILASLEFVDIVLIYQEDTPVRLLNVLRPDVLIKGANYTHEEVVGAEVVKGYGGEILLVNIASDHKPNSTIERITNGTL
jgi:D-beta-D-heptose 7-phosphate kinase/D-beta-D-heptose 1-phosphate adenosyltransferase